MSTKTSAFGQATFRPLSKDEIDRKIDSLVQGLGLSSVDVPSANREPQWISTAELVERMRPFLVLN